MSRKIPVWDLYIDGQEDPVLQGVHKTQANVFIADLKKNGIRYTLTKGKAIEPSKFSKRRKNRDIRDE